MTAKSLANNYAGGFASNERPPTVSIFKLTETRHDDNRNCQQKDYQNEDCINGLVVCDFVVVLATESVQMNMRSITI